MIDLEHPVTLAGHPDPRTHAPLIARKDGSPQDGRHHAAANLAAWASAHSRVGFFWQKVPSGFLPSHLKNAE